MKKAGADSFAVEFMEHCSCDGTYDENGDSFLYTWEEVCDLAEKDAEPRTPDVKTEDDALLRLWRWVREHPEMPEDGADTVSF